MERRLAAIMVADVVGYSRLMGANEVATLSALKTHRNELVDGSIAENHGRIVKLTGDGMLAEFPSVVSAVECAAKIQREMRMRNADVPEDRRIEFRIGINLGDIIFEGNDIYGDGVNIAARIESVARPGGVAVSAVVRDNVGNRLDLTFEDAGEQTLKNIERPVRVFNVISGAPHPAGTGKQGAVRPTAPDKPSIAILPFANLSNDPEQEFFSEGITEDIITDLSKVSGLFVLGRNTVAAYKSKAANLDQIARQLGVAYVVEGSVRTVGQRVRINAQLIEAATGGHLWAERYDRDLTDIFAVQDEITKAIVGQLKVKLLPEERHAIEQSPTRHVEAYTHFLKGRQFLHSAVKSSLILARRMFAIAVELDPHFARAYAGMANCDSRLISKHGVAISAEEILATAGKALELEPNLAEAHAARGYAFMIGSHPTEANSEFEQALALDPNCYEANQFYAEFCVTTGNFARAAQHYLRAMEIQPDDYQSPLHLQAVFQSLGRPEEAARYAKLGVKRAEDALRLHPENSKPAQQGACALAFLGERDRAKEWLARAMAIDPDDNIGRYNAACTYSLLGEIDRSFDLLEICLQQFGSDMKLWFRHDSDLDPLRAHPRYQRLLELVG